MTPDPVTITSSCTMTDAATIMLGEKLNRLPVVDDEGDLVGLLSASDVMRHLTCDPEEDCRVN